jgi:hypothetical protein
VRSSENAVIAKFSESSSLLKNLSTPLPSTLQGLKNPAIAVFWRGFLSVWMQFLTTDWSYNDFFNTLLPRTLVNSYLSVTVWSRHVTEARALVL